MRKLQIRRPSPAMVVAAVALCFSVAGTAVAAGVFSHQEKRAVKKIANKQIKKKAAGLTVGSANTAKNVMAALLPNGDSCAITRQTGGITATLTGSGQTGVCDVTFPRSLANCVVGATPEHPIQDITGQTGVRYLSDNTVRVIRRNDVSNFQAAGLVSVLAICA